MRAKLSLAVLILFLVSGCTSSPEGIRPVSGFEIDRYLGTWYEIARLDHSFERGLSHVRADYELKEDGGLRVINRGYSREDRQWKQADGRAYFVDDDDLGHLKVSFFGPFYSAYVIFELDREDYQYAYVTGYNRDYLWLLARSPRVPEDRIRHFVATARDKGYDTDGLIFVDHDPLPEN